MKIFEIFWSSVRANFFHTEPKYDILYTIRFLSLSATILQADAKQTGAKKRKLWSTENFAHPTWPYLDIFPEKFWAATRNFFLTASKLTYVGTCFLHFQVDPRNSSKVSRDLLLKMRDFGHKTRVSTRKPERSAKRLFFPDARQKVAYWVPAVCGSAQPNLRY